MPSSALDTPAFRRLYLDELLTEAIASKRVLRIAYRGEVRDVLPIRVKSTWDDFNCRSREHVVACDVEAAGLSRRIDHVEKSFRIDRIDDVRPTYWCAGT